METHLFATICLAIAPHPRQLRSTFISTYAKRLVLIFDAYNKPGSIVSSPKWPLHSLTDRKNAAKLSQNIDS